MLGSIKMAVLTGQSVGPDSSTGLIAMNSQQTFVVRIIKPLIP